MAVKTSLTAKERRRLLADCWFEAMREHYHLLGQYLRLRDLVDISTGWTPARLQPTQLRAPRRPDELPESLSRYVTAAHYSEHLI